MFALSHCANFGKILMILMKKNYHENYFELGAWNNFVLLIYLINLCICVPKFYILSAGFLQTYECCDHTRQYPRIRKYNTAFGIRHYTNFPLK